MNKRKQRAATSHVTRKAQLLSWTEHHTGCLKLSLQRLFRTPLASILTMAVLAIALALPGGLYILSQNMLGLSKHWDTDTQMTLYLTADVDDQQGELLSRQLAKDPRFIQVSFLSRDQALEEFRQMTAFQAALEHIADNPLPAVILITPSPTLSTEALAEIRTDMLEESEVELAQLDLDWIKRLRGIIEIIQHAVIIYIPAVKTVEISY